MSAYCVPNLTEKLNCSGTSPGGSGSNELDSGCDPEDVAFKNIVGYGKAKCTKPGKKSGKNLSGHSPVVRNRFMLIFAYLMHRFAQLFFRS